jgi:Ca2+/Na+ antiporter
LALKNFNKNKENFFIIISIIAFSLSLIFHQMVTSNQIYIFFLIPLLTAFVHIFFVPILNKNKILLYLTIAICIFSVVKYHYRFNEERKFNELQNVDLKKSIDAGAIHSSLAGLKWITMNFPENPKTEINALKEWMHILRKKKKKKSLITAYQFIAPSLLIYDFSPNQWHHPTVSFPIKGQKYFEIYKSFFVKNIKQNNIDIVYSIGKVEKGILGLILTNNCFETKKEGKIIFSHKLLKDCEDFQ